MLLAPSASLRDTTPLRLRSLPELVSDTAACAWHNDSVHVIAVVNRKGGVGKTTTAVNLAAALALDCRRVLLLDLDPQGSAGVAVSVSDSRGDGSGGMFRGKPRWRARRSPVPSLNTLGVVPADDRLRAEEAAASTDRRRGVRLAAALEAASAEWDVVVVDTPPGVGGLSASALRAADSVVIPAAADYLSIHALQATIESVRSIERETGRRYTPLVLLPTFVDPRRPSAVDATAHGDSAQRPVRLVRPGGGPRGGRRAALDGRGRLPWCMRRHRGPARTQGAQAPRNIEGVRPRRHARGAHDDAARPPSTDW
jgi:chromosome partitioning protein